MNDLDTHITPEVQGERNLTEALAEPGEEKATFFVHVQFHRNATWQGTVTWTERQVTKKYRSALELINLIGSAIDHTGETPGNWDTASDED